MANRISYKYPFLATARPDVDWRHVSPILLRQLNAMGRELGKVIVIFSGYRSDKYSAAHGGFAGDPHTHHIAVDATIGGKPIGSVVPARLFVKYGMRSGNQPNFYKGKPDPSHVDLVGTSAGKVAEAQYGKSAAPSAPAPASTGQPEGAAVLPDYTGGAQVGPQPSGPPAALDPGTVPAGGFTPQMIAKSLQTVAEQPFAGPTSAWYARASGGG